LSSVAATWTRAMLKRTTIFIFLLLLVIGGLAFIKYQQIQQGMAMMAANTPPPATVEVVPALKTLWQPRVSAVGTLTAREGIEVSNEVEGVIEKIHVESGQHVEKGDLLVTLNDDVEQADLLSYKAQEQLARTLFKRNEDMWKKKTISETDFDNASSNLKVAQANVSQTLARIAKKIYPCTIQRGAGYQAGQHRSVSADRQQADQSAG
jgi:membrane fusion protein (multidrug efflux system)